MSPTAPKKLLRGVVPVTVTAYHPWDAPTPKAKRMEGGFKDRKGWPLHNLEDHLADPLAHPFVSVAGDWTLYRYGQRVKITLPGVDGAPVFRIVDTGGHFYGAGKVYRHPGREPVDVCCRTRKGWRFKADMEIVEGDVLDPRTGKPPTEKRRVR